MTKLKERIGAASERLAKLITNGELLLCTQPDELLISAADEIELLRTERDIAIASSKRMEWERNALKAEVDRLRDALQAIGESAIYAASLTQSDIDEMKTTTTAVTDDIKAMLRREQ